MEILARRRISIPGEPAAVRSKLLAGVAAAYAAAVADVAAVVVVQRPGPIRSSGSSQQIWRWD